MRQDMSRWIPFGRWCTLVLPLALSAACGPAAQEEAAAAVPKGTVVIVHGAWGGAWDWRETADSMGTLGFDTHRVTLTGLGERSHLLSPDVDLTTHVTDVVNVLRWEELEDVILVGHSYGGMVITGVAEVVPERIRRLVYFDAFVPMDGECALAVGRPGEPEALCSMEALGQAMGSPTADGGIPAAWVPEDAPVPRDVPHPGATLVEPIELVGEPAHGLPAAYVITREVAGGEDGFDVPAERAGALGWPVVEYVGDHTPYREDPGGIARLLVSFEDGSGG
ncbi:MAG: alpha/beta hydrolase [Gemmatimonadota bacterium]